MARTQAAPAAPPKGKPGQAHYGNDEKVLLLLKRCVDDARRNTARLERDKQDLQNLFMYRGGPQKQWTVWDAQAQTYVERPFTGDAGLPEYFPRCCSNLFGKKIDGIVSILNQSQPALEWKPATDDDADLAAAQVVERAMPVLLDEVGYDTLRAQTHKLLALTDKVVQVIYFDDDEKYGMHDIPAYQCAQCGQFAMPMEIGEDGGCPDCGGPMQPAQDPTTGALLGKPYPKGKICAELLTSFESSAPRSARTCDETQWPWFLAHRRYAKEDALREWPALKEHFQDQGGSGTGGSGRFTSQNFADQTRSLSSATTQDGTGQVGAQNTGPIIWRLWHDPITDDEVSFPEGLYAVIYEDEVVLEASPLPLHDDDGRPIKNLVVRSYVHAPGSPWGKPPADDLVPLQVQQNLALSLAFLILMHNAAPRTFIPSTVTLLDEMTGVPGANIPYRSLGNDRPHTEPGQAFPPALEWFLGYLKEAFDDLSGLNAVLQGARPAGDPTLGEVQILQERGLAAFKEPLDNLVEGEKRFNRLLLWTAKETAWAPRFRQVQGQNGEWEIEQFTAADLTGSVDVMCEPTSAWPRSPLLQNMRVQHAIEAQILNPADPEVQSEYLSLNDLQAFKKSIDADRKQVARQLDAWRAATTPAAIEPPQPFWNLPVHLFLKSEFLKSEEWEELRAANAPTAAAMLQHVLTLQQMRAPPPTAPPAPPPTGSQGALDHAVKSGALRPAGTPKGPGDTLHHAVQSGALKPVQPAPAGPPAAAAPAPAAPMAAAMPPMPGPSIDQLVAAQAAQPLSPHQLGAGQ